MNTRTWHSIPQGRGAPRPVLRAVRALREARDLVLSVLARAAGYRLVPAGRR